MENEYFKDVETLVDKAHGRLPTDIGHAKNVELLTMAGGMVWINIDGVCALRVFRADAVIVDTTHALSTDKQVV